jgi:hypothetical protein
VITATEHVAGEESSPENTQRSTCVGYMKLIAIDLACNLIIALV